MGGQLQNAHTRAAEDDGGADRGDGQQVSEVGIAMADEHVRQRGGRATGNQSKELGRSGSFQT